MTRVPLGAYADPVDVLWLRCAARCGLTVVRDDTVYASTDGRGTLRLCPPDAYDPDDSLAQLILHELCHGLVQGPARRQQVDWGLDNTDDAGCAHAEHACHRLQAALLDRYGLRDLFAVTTDWRPYWDALPADPLAPGDDPAIAMARAAWPDALRGPWGAAIDDALRATAAIADAVRAVAPAESLWVRTAPRHPVTGWALRGGASTCGDCAWRDHHGRCVVAGEDDDGPEVAAATPACLHHEARLDADACAACGACCREGFHAVTVEPDEPLADHPRAEAVPGEPWRLLPRPGGCCVLLTHAPEGWRCTRYDARPRACREFEVGGAHCLTARRRTGLSRL